MKQNATEKKNKKQNFGPKWISVVRCIGPPFCHLVISCQLCGPCLNHS